MWRMPDCSLASIASHGLFVVPYALFTATMWQGPVHACPHHAFMEEAPFIINKHLHAHSMTRVRAEGITGWLLLQAGVVWERSLQQQGSLPSSQEASAP